MRDDTGIARRLLVAPQREPAIPAERIEPVQRKQRLHEDIDQKVLRLVVSKLMRKREVARGPIFERHETLGQGNHGVDHAERERGIGPGRFHQADLARAPYFTRAAEQFAAQLEIAVEPAPKEDGSADQPHRASDLDPRGGVEKRWRGNRCDQIGRYRSRSRG